MSNGHLVWSFILRPLNYHSNLNLPSNHISSINDMTNLLKTFKFQQDYEVLCTNIYAIFSMFWLLSNWKYCHINKDLLLSNHLFLRNLASAAVAREP